MDRGFLKKLIACSAFALVALLGVGARLHTQGISFLPGPNGPGILLLYVAGAVLLSMMFACAALGHYALRGQGVEGRNPLRRFLSAYAIVLALLLVVAVVAHSAGVSLLPADDSPGLLLLVLGLGVAAYFLLFLIGVGYYIYHDAERRGMSPLLWALVCVLAPYFIGLIVYLVVRSPLPARCPACGASAPRESAFCPKCGKRIRRQCPSCHATLDEGYRFCPTCGAAVEVLQA